MFLKLLFTLSLIFSHISSAESFIGLTDIEYDELFGNETPADLQKKYGCTDYDQRKWWEVAKVEPTWLRYDNPETKVQSYAVTCKQLDDLMRLVIQKNPSDE